MIFGRLYSGDFCNDLVTFRRKRYFFFRSCAILVSPLACRAEIKTRGSRLFVPEQSKWPWRGCRVSRYCLVVSGTGDLCGTLCSEMRIIMRSRFNRIRTMAGTIAVAAAVTFALPAAGTAVWAATGTVTGSDINVRSEASSDSSQVGTVTTGDVVTVGETATDSSGATWYQVTLSNGTTGYVRGDFLTVDESSDEQTDGATDGSSDDASADASAEATDAGTDTAAAEATAAAEQDTGGYQVVLAPDENGTDTYYLYDNNAGQRMKISDIDKLQDDVTTANEQAASVKKTYTVLVIVLAAAAAILLVGCIVLFLKLRDALANGRRERDLTMERRDQRRNDHRADSVESLRRPREQASRSGRGRDDAYASVNTRRVERDGAGRDRDVRRAPAADRRPVRPAAQQEGYATRPAARPAAPARDAEGRPARPAARPANNDAPVRHAAEPSRSAAEGNAPVRRTARPAASAGNGESRTARPAAEASGRRTAETARPAAKNFADDDFDYDFLKLDDAD